MNEKYFVISGNLAEFTEFRKRKCEELYKAGRHYISYSHFIYVKDTTSLKGYSKPHGWFIGTWKNRGDIHEIIYELRIHHYNGIPAGITKAINEILPNQS